MPYSHVTKSRDAAPTISSTLLLTLAALGVVYGDIGTSPLYALKEAFHYIAPTRENVMGIVSLMFWSLIVVVTIKYVIFLLNTDHHGEGGITALIGLVKKQVHPIHIVLGVFGVALLYGDGMITPAISVLSAVEGLKVVAPAADRLVIPITVLILVGLFSVQRYGTQLVGNTFGPVMICWFLTMGILGFFGILLYPQVLAAVNPVYAVQFFVHNGVIGFLTLGAVVLVVTGGEALYADMGHFGALPVRLGWLSFALPSLVLNYFRQAALVITNPEMAEHPFYSLAPSWFQLPLVLLATLATIIASQALITGAYSLTRQLIDLHALPAIEIVSTSVKNHGQIYVPTVNKILLMGCIALVLFFQSSSGLAAAYGIAVTGTMAITTWLWYHTLVQVKGWQLWHARVFLVVFVLIDLTFFGANLVKFAHGGWIPLTIAFLGTAGMEWYYFHNRELLRAKKVPFTVTQTFNTDVSSVIVFIDEYAHCGTKLLIGAAKALNAPYKLVHIATRPERVELLEHYLAEIGESVEIIDSPSGDLLHPAVEYVRSIQENSEGMVWIFLGQSVVHGDTPLLHPNGAALMERLQTLKGVVITRVPWVVETQPVISLNGNGQHALQIGMGQ
ncbi:KUP/HAK/KT family potassium transporter [Candidatus Roizmanbacteria bacterium]|nr:MAG: KUP/HAK/KT family potassium transporter [Candidatus Roizmanbacteria bacterium]